MPPPNDSFAGRTVLPTYAGIADFDLTGATSETGEAVLWNGYTVWYELPTAPAPAKVPPGTVYQVRMEGAALGDHVLALYASYASQPEPAVIADTFRTGFKYGTAATAAVKEVSLETLGEPARVYVQLDAATQISGRLAWGLFVPEPGPWEQAPDYPITIRGDVGGWRANTPRHPSAYTDEQLAIDTGDGINLSAGFPERTAPGSLINGRSDAHLQITDDAVRFPEAPIAGLLARTSVPIRGVALVDLGNGRDLSTYEFPSDLTSIGYEFEGGAQRGTMIGGLTLAGRYAANSYVGTNANPAPVNLGGSLWRSTQDDSAYRAVSAIEATYEQMLTWLDTDGAPVAFSLTEPASTFYGADSLTQASRTMYLHALTEALTSPGTGLRHPPGQQVTSYDAAADEMGVTATIRPPRHRFIYLTAYKYPRVPPPLRQFQRNDGLALGAPRQINRSSLQRSIRQGPRPYR